MRLVRISLAAKYRILFGLAVLLIIGAALAVPWFLMNELVLEQPYREAQRAADDYFRLVMPHPELPGASGGGVHGQEFSLFPNRQVLPRYYALTGDPNDPAALINQDTLPGFVRQAFRRFLLNPTQSSFHRTRRLETGERFEYAQAVRVSQRCLECHSDTGGARPLSENQLAGVLTVTLPVSDELILINRLWIIAAGVLAGILAILVFYLITHRFILGPIEELRSVTVRVAEGDLAIRSQLETGDEFEQLSDSVNTMLERLRAQQEKLKSANKALDQKLGEMAEMNVALYESNRIKSEFLANVSHELRTPLSSIIGFAELLRESPSNEPNSRAARYAENILISGRILLEIINDLLDLARIEAGKMQVNFDALAPAEIGGTLVDFMRPLADKKQITVRLIAEDDLPNITSDRTRLRQILYNLLSNAIKFTPQGGDVSLGISREGADRVRFAVRDTGPGIAPEHQKLIFDKFRQIDASATREHHGTGLGLAIAKELSELLGGSLTVQSTLGQGAEFALVIPLEISEAHERAPISLT